MEFKQTFYLKRQQFQVQIRKNRRKSDQNDFRHKLLLNVFMHNSLNNQKLNIQRFIQNVKEYINNQPISIQIVLTQLSSTLASKNQQLIQIDSTSLKIFIELFSKCQNQKPLEFEELQANILKIIKNLPRYIILNDGDVLKNILADFIQYLLTVKQQHLRYTLSIIKNFSKFVEVRKIILSSERIISRLLFITEVMTSSLEKKNNNVSIIKKLINLWEDIDINKLSGVYKLAIKVATNFNDYLEKINGLTNQNYIIKALDLIHKCFKEAGQQISQLPYLTHSYMIFQNILSSSQVTESKKSVLQTMNYIISKSSKTCEILLKDTNFPQIISQKSHVLYHQMTFKIIKNILCIVGRHHKLQYFMKQFALQFVQNLKLTVQKRRLIWQVLLLWFQDYKEQVLSESDYIVLSIISRSTEPVDEETQGAFWKYAMEIGYDRAIPEYLYMDFANYD